MKTITTEEQNRYGMYCEAFARKVWAKRRAAAAAAARREKAKKAEASKAIEAKAEAAICNVTVRQVIQELSEKIGVPVPAIVGPNQHPAMTAARHEAMAEVARRRPEMSLTLIGREFGGRSRKAVRYALDKHGIPDRYPREAG